ncbi:MAG: hypothetical protein HQM02_01255 [Magnetococcales bacterium]|nr:hypothetical protein [Magnetococcales bacterium]
MPHLKHSACARWTRVALGALLIWGAVAPTGSLAENLIVFKAVGIKLTPGQSIDGEQPLPLSAGQKVDLIAPNGRIVKLAGPWQQAPSPGSPGKSDTVAAAMQSLVTSGRQDTSHMGVTRSASTVLNSGGKEWLPDPWLIDVTQSGPHCQRTGQPVVLWRPAMDQEAEIRLATAGNTWKANARWPAGAEKLAPPPTMPLKDGALLKVTLDRNTTDLTLKMIPEQVTQPPVLAAWMTESGCRAQSMALLRTLP